MEQILEINIKDLAALIAAIVAILGLIITSILNILKRRDELIESQLRHFQEISNSVASDSIALRSVGLQNITHYLNDKRFCEMTRRILVNNLLFEKDRHLQSQTLELLISDESNFKKTMKDLIKLNRLTWNSMSPVTICVLKSECQKALSKFIDFATHIPCQSSSLSKHIMIFCNLN